MVHEVAQHLNYINLKAFRGSAKIPTFAKRCQISSCNCWVTHMKLVTYQRKRRATTSIAKIQAPSPPSIRTDRWPGDRIYINKWVGGWTTEHWKGLFSIRSLILYFRVAKYRVFLNNSTSKQSLPCDFTKTEWLRKQGKWLEWGLKCFSLPLEFQCVNYQSMWSKFLWMKMGIYIHFPIRL